VIVRERVRCLAGLRMAGTQAQMASARASALPVSVPVPTGRVKIWPNIEPRRHYCSVSTDEQKALSPLVIPLGAIPSVECNRRRSTK
jgi:hypothetical protein